MVDIDTTIQLITICICLSVFDKKKGEFSYIYRLVYIPTPPNWLFIQLRRKILDNSINKSCKENLLNECKFPHHSNKPQIRHKSIHFSDNMPVSICQNWPKSDTMILLFAQTFSQKKIHLILGIRKEYSNLRTGVIIVKCANPISKITRVFNGALGVYWEWSVSNIFINFVVIRHCLKHYHTAAVA